MATTTYLRLFPAVKQFELKNGALNVGGRLFVYYEGTDDLAEIYDENGSRLQQPAILDNDGRALGLFVDAKKVYRLEVQDAFGAMQFTVRKMVPSGGGAGSALGNQYDVISSDGSITVDKYDDGGVTKFDLGLAPNDSDEFLEWIKCSEEDCGSTWIPAYQEGTMETDVQGIKVHKDQLYHFTNTFYVDPDGTGITYDTFKVDMYCNDEIVDSRNFDIDTSVNDAVQCEFSTDVIPAEDGHVYFKLTIPATCEVTGEVQCHRIYSGINAVPDTCATKQWVQETFDYNLSSKVDYSAIGYNEYGQISGISGSAIAGGLDSATVSSIASSVASSYTESAFSSISSWTADLSSISSKADSSSLSAYQPVSAMSSYATEAYVDARMGDKLDATASSLFLTGLPDDLATTGDVASAVSGKMDKADGSAFYPMTGNPSGFLTAHQSLAGLATVGYVDSSVISKLDTSAFASASAGFAPTGDYAYNSSLSAYYPASASGAFAPSGNYQTAGDYAFNSAVSAKLDSSASSNFVVNSSMTSWIPYSALDYSGTAISGIGGSSLAGMGGGGGDYTGVYPVNVDNTAREISVDSLPLVTDSSMTAYGSAGSSVIGVNLDIMSGKQDTLTFDWDADSAISSINGSALAGGGGVDSATVSAIASAYAESSVSSVSGDYYSTSNPSGFITQGDMFPYVIKSGTSARAVITPTFQDNNINRPTLMVSAYKSSNGKWPRMMVTDYNGSTGYTHSGVLLANAYETYIGTAIAGESGVKTFRMDEYSMNFLPFRVWNTSTQSWYTADLESSYYHTAKYSRYGVTLSALENSGENALFNQFLNSGIYMSSTDYAYLDTADTASGMSATASASAEINIDSINRWNGKADSSALTSYALSADVSGTVDLVSTQSANWGGSALALSAGPGVKLEKVGNVLVASTDETVLWSGTVSTDACSTFTLSEYASHFDRLRFYGSSYANTPVMYECPAPINSTMPLSVTYVYYCASSDGSPSQCRQSNYTSTNGLVFNASTHRFAYGSDARYSAGNTTQGAPIYKIVGINRTAEA